MILTATPLQMKSTFFTTLRFFLGNKARRVLQISGIVCCLLLTGWSARAEGTKQIMPDPTQPTRMSVNNPGLTHFASYRANADEHLNIHISNPGTELIYYGFGVVFKGDIPPGTSNLKVYYRIRSPHGVIVLEDSTPQSGAGFINSYDEAIAGPAPVVGGGYNPLVFKPDSAGDYYIEFNSKFKVQPKDSLYQEFKFSFIDITVANKISNVAYNGRLWSKVWDLSCLYLSHSAKNSFYVYTPDSMVTKLYMNGMRPFGYTVLCNSTGVRRSGTLSFDRKSSINKEFYPEYKIFLSDPDQDVYPNGSPADISSPVQFGTCTGSAYCIQVGVTKPSYADAYINLNGVPGYQAGSTDVKFDQQLKAGINCFLWSGLDGLGNRIAPGTRIKFNLNLVTGLTNFPIYDAEYNENGLVVTTVRPSGGSPTVYWDDSQIPDGTVNLGGCQSINGSGCHIWSVSPDDVGGAGQGFGNERTMNTWWSSYNQLTDTAIVVPLCDLSSIVSQRDTLYKGQAAVRICPNDNNYDPGKVLIHQLTTIRGGSLGFLQGSPDSCFTWKPYSTTLGRDTVVMQICDRNTPQRCYYDTTYLVIINLPGPTVFRTDTTISENTTTPVVIDPNGNNRPRAGMNNNLTTITRNGRKGRATMSGGLVSYLPTAGATGNDTVYLSVCNLNNVCKTDSIIYHIINQPIVAYKQVVNLLNYNSYSINPNSNNFDPNGNIDYSSLSYWPGTLPPVHGTVSFVNGVLTYLPDGNNPGTDYIFVKVCDLEGLCTEDTVIFNVPYAYDITVTNEFLYVQSGCNNILKVRPGTNDAPAGYVDTLNITPVRFPKQGTITYLNGQLVYKTSCSGSGIDTVVVQECTVLANPLKKCAYDTIFVTLVNSPPVTHGDKVTLTCLDSVNIDYNANTGKRYLPRPRQVESAYRNTHLLPLRRRGAYRYHICTCFR